MRQINAATGRLKLGPNDMPGNATHQPLVAWSFPGKLSRAI